MTGVIGVAKVVDVVDVVVQYSSVLLVVDT
jgi:hypothetical protein